MGKQKNKDKDKDGIEAEEDEEEPREEREEEGGNRDGKPSSLDAQSYITSEQVNFAETFFCLIELW